MAHICNPSYSGGGDGEDFNLSKSREKSSQDSSQPIEARHGGLYLLSPLCEEVKQEDHDPGWPRA
jgi:hypothetical protein